LGFAEGLGEDHSLLTISIGTNTFGQLATFGAVLSSFTLTLGAHPLEYTAVDLARQIHAFDPHIDHLNTQFATRAGIQVSSDIGHQLVSLTCHDFMQSTA